MGIETMNLRDYFAAQAMRALLSRAGENPRDADPDTIAVRAYNIAEAMLTESAQLKEERQAKKEAEKARNPPPQGGPIQETRSVLEGGDY
jgi:hypothetical protein